MSFEPLPDEIADAAIARARATVMARVATAPAAPIRTRRRAPIIVAAAGALALGGASFAALASTEDERARVECYSAADLGSTRVTIDLSDASSTQASGNAPLIDPAGACVLPWEQGSLVNAAATKNSPVPALAACVQANGVGAAFPIRDGLSAKELCGLLGLAEWSSE